MTSFFNILVTGGNGQIAHAITHHAASSKVNLTALSRHQLDIATMPAIERAIQEYRPQVIINTAAYTAVDLAEREKDLAFLANETGAKNLAVTCATHGIILLHLSTDYVFDGTKSSPYLEDDLPNPLNIYGLSKWQGEEAIRNHCPSHFIIRVSGVFSRHGNNFFNTMTKLNQEKRDLRIVADQTTCPTAANDIAGMLLTLAQQRKHFGTYHYCSTPAVTWHGFAESILQKPLTAITTAEYPTAAKRPANAVLDCHKINSVFGISQPSWEQALCQL